MFLIRIGKVSYLYNLCFVFVFATYIRTVLSASWQTFAFSCHYKLGAGEYHLSL